MYEINDNMYENVIIVSKRSREIISENSLDLQKMEEGFESTEEIEEIKIEDPNKEKAIITAANEFVDKKIDWDKKVTD
jgi:DNA-directed RNA polymerase subunit K/omega